MKSIKIKMLFMICIWLLVSIFGMLILARNMNDTKKVSETLLSRQMQDLDDISGLMEQFKSIQMIKVLVVPNEFNMGYLSVQNAVQAVEKDTAYKKTIVEHIVVTGDTLHKEENQRIIFPIVQ